MKKDKYLYWNLLITFIYAVILFSVLTIIHWYAYNYFFDYWHIQTGYNKYYFYGGVLINFWSIPTPKWKLK